MELTKLKSLLLGESSGCQQRRSELQLGKFDVRAQTVSLKDDESIHVCSLVKDGKLITKFYDGVLTLYDAFQRGLTLSKHSHCLGWRPQSDLPYKWLTYEQVFLRAKFFGSGLIKYGFSAGQETYIGVYSINRIGWVLTEQAVNMYSMILVPLYDTLGADACKFICNQAELKVIICDNEKRAAILVNQASDIPNLKTLILMEKATDDFIKQASDFGITVLQFNDVEEAGEKENQDPVCPKPDDICTICYTSGTTGNPKGAMLSHGNIIASCNGFMAISGGVMELRTGDVFISYLPLAHVYERFCQTNLFMHGASIGFFQGDAKLLLNDLAALKPTFFPCVPRVMNKIYDKVTTAVSAKGGLTKIIFNKALRSKKREIERGIVRNNGLWDMVFKKIRMLTGGRVRFMTTGAAPISPEIKIFFKAVFGCLLLEGYGQTESGSLTSITSPRDLSDGHVGTLSPHVQVKLIDVPDLEYFAAKGKGEICVKGSGIFKGYYKDPEKTAETIDKDGYLHSGDIGEFTKNGQLRIVDRVKHIFKLSQGEYVAPEKIENDYLTTEGVSQIYVHGESLEDCCVGIVVPDEEWLLKYAAKQGWGGDFKALCDKNEVQSMISDRLKKTAVLSELKGFEQVKMIKLHSELFSVENGLLTPTFKSKRPILKTFFKDDITHMYAKRAENKIAADAAKAAAV